MHSCEVSPRNEQSNWLGTNTKRAGGWGVLHLAICTNKKKQKTRASSDSDDSDEESDEDEESEDEESENENDS